jgi:predicted MFS family arabinose efflux permease
MTILFVTVSFLLVSFGVGTIIGNFIAFGMGTDKDRKDS